MPRRFTIQDLQKSKVAHRNLMLKTYRFYIGIDAGVNTGYAVWNKPEQKLMVVTTLPIHQAMEKIRRLHELNTSIFVRVEDARLRSWFGKSGREQLQGAGSIKRDAKIWEDFLTDLGVPFELVAPKNNKTKTTAEQFKRLTGWDERTNVHGRDAGMLVVGS